MNIPPLKHDLKGLTAIEWGVQNYYLLRTDEELAIGLDTTVEVVRQTMKDLGLERPKGTETMKEAARQYLMEMSSAEKRAFLKSIDPEKVWEMAEGKAATTGSLEVHQEPLRIDITHQLLKVYGPDSARIINQVPGDSEISRLPARSSK